MRSFSEKPQGRKNKQGLDEFIELRRVYPYSRRIRNTGQWIDPSGDCVSERHRPRGQLKLPPRLRHPRESNLFVRCRKPEQELALRHQHPGLRAAYFFEDPDSRQCSCYEPSIPTETRAVKDEFKWGACEAFPFLEDEKQAGPKQSRDGCSNDNA